MTATGCKTVAEAIMRDLLLEALPHVEDAFDDPTLKPAGRDAARKLAGRIRATLKAMEAGV